MTHTANLMLELWIGFLDRALTDLAETMMTIVTRQTLSTFNMFFSNLTHIYTFSLFLHKTIPMI